MKIISSIKIYRIIAICFCIIVIGNQYAIVANANGITNEETNTNIPLDYNGIIQYEEVDKVTNSLLQEMDIEMPSFFEVVQKIINNNGRYSMEEIFQMLLAVFTGQLSESSQIIKDMLFIAIISALFTIITTTFSKDSASEAGFIITYLMMFIMLISTFRVVMEIGVHAGESIVAFIKGLIPTYFIAVALSAGGSSASIFYHSTILLASFAQILIIDFIIPLINIYMALVLVNSISKEDTFSKLAKLIKSCILYVLKTITGLVIGINAVQGLIVPIVDSLKMKIAESTLSSVPFIGNTLNSITGTLIGSAVLIKNSIGIAGVIFIVILTAAPLIKIAAYMLMYKGIGALIQPITDKRIVNGLTGVGEAIGLLMKAIFTMALLFLLTIAIIAFTTNSRYYAG